MERLPQYWVVRNDGSEDFYNSVIKYLESKIGCTINTNSPVFQKNSFSNYAGEDQDGGFFNKTYSEVNRRKEIITLPLHLFKTLVENENKPKSTRKSVTIPPPNSGTITGYTLKYGVSNEAALRALGISESSPMFRNNSMIPISFESNTQLYFAAIQAGILDLLFNPLYKPKTSDVIVRHNKGHLIAHIESGYVTIDGQRFSTSDVQRILSPSKIRGINFKPTTFTTGCNNQYEGIDRKDIEQVLDQMIP